MDKNILLVCLAMIALVNAQNECSDTIYKPLGDLAKRSPTYFQDSVPLCDRYLAPGWYVALNYEMPTTAPGLWECGTTYPVWLSDTLPETQGSTKLAKVCEVDFSGSCSRNHSIQITNCGKFFVYKLTPLDRCSSAYCFKKDESCVSDVLSNISVAYHSVTWNTREEGITTYHDPEVNLVCQFDRLPDQSLYYDVTWYVDDTEVLTNQTVSSNSSDLALLTGSHLFANGKKANSMIHCIVGAKINETGTPCNTAGSSLFFAGIKVLNSTLRIPRGGRQDVMLQFTIPFINQNIVRQGATSTVQNPLYISLGVHGGSLTCDDKHKKACDYTVPAYEKQETYKYETDDWKVIHSIPIYNKDNGVYKINDKHITLRLETGFTESPGSKIFQYLSLPDIQVYIEDDDSAWKGAMCASHTDPHMMTFDKKRYECQLDGTYILYRNTRFEQEVQERHHMCHPDFSHPRCSCAVAVRSGKDVFMVDICNNQPIIHFPSCGDGVLKVIKINDKYFKVTLPTGTLVEIKFVQWPYLDDWQLNVEIFPSPSDIGTSRGLCGILDGDYINDFTRSDGTVDSPHLTYPDAFSESWRVKDNQLDLFDHQHYTNLISISEVFDYVCTCKTEYENGRLVKKNIECNYGTHQNCNFVFGKRYFCILNPEGQLRRKRDVRHLKSMFSNSQNDFGIDFDERRQKRENVLYIKTYEEAETICNTAFESSTSYRICREHVTDLSNTSLVNCISDVMMTGDDNFTRIHIEAALEQCSVFVVFNTTFQETEPDITYTIETFCQNNCSGHGICNAGNCTCENGYAGSDCSFDLLGPPTIFHMSDFGLCDKSKEACDEITLFGKYFIENMNTNCFMTRNTLNEEGTSISVVNYVIGLEERTLFEGYCPLEYDTSNNWVTEFSFNISNDGSRFTENFQVYTYQSFCQEFRNDTGNITFVFKDGYCFINNSCVSDGSTNTNNTCDICNTTKSKYEWSYNEGHCLISGVCYKSGENNGTNPCSICDPLLDKTVWSPNTEFCFIDGICYSNGQTQIQKNCLVCQTNSSRTDWTLKKDHCLINGLCFMNSQANVSNSCQLCNTSQSNDSWTDNPDFCSINGECYQDSQTKVGKDCLFCQPNSTRTNWTLKNDYCFINEHCFMNSQSNESNYCQLCNTSRSNDSWTENPDFCSINGICYNESQTEVGKDCLVCQPNSTRTNWTLKMNHCLINELCFMNNQSNESKPCQLCNTSQSKNSWTENPDYCSINGTCYSDGQTQVGKDCLVCQPNSTRTNWTLKNDYCLINELCYMDSQSNESNPCQLCNTSQSKELWTENPDYCSINASCYSDGQTQVGKDCLVCQPNSTRTNWTLKNYYCLINELCYMNSQSNESNPCQLCNTSQSKELWTENPDFCSINGICYNESQTEVGQDCLVCQPNSTRTNWTLKKNHCLINELCFLSGQYNESNPCQHCNSSQSEDSWTENPDFCFINGTCYNDSQTQIGKDCLVCQPNSSRTNWTLKKDYCLINELCFMDNQSNESNPCQLCNTSQSKDTWTENPDFCSINGICYDESQTEVGKGCLVCQPNSTRTNWTLKKNYCLINELCYMNRQSNESNPCQLCNTSQSKELWTENPDYCSINGTCYSDGQTQVGTYCLVCQPNSTRINWTLKNDYCLINELCYMNSQSNESNPCQLCNTSQSKESWTENLDYCSINGTCYSDGQTQVGKDCLVCQPNSTRTNWILKNDYCLINELCLMNSQSNESNPCQLCNISQSKESWTENPDSCIINGTCYSNGQTQLGKYCLVCQPNSTKISWTLKNDHCLINELCLMNGQSNESNPCQLCNASQSADTWTENPDCLNVTSNGPSTASSSEPSTTTTEPTTSTPEHTTTTPEPATTTQELTTTAQKPTTTTPEPTTTTPEPTTTIPEHTTTTPEPTTTTQTPTTTTPEPTFTSLDPTSTTPKPTITTQEPTTTTSEPTTTTPEPTTTTLKPTTTTQEPTTSSLKPNTTTQEPTTTTSQPTTTSPEPTTTLEPTTSTLEPTTTTIETTTTPEPTTTTPKPTTTTQGSTTTTPQPTTTTPEPTTSTEHTTTTLEPSTTTPEPITITSVPLTTEHPNCMKSPEDVSVEYHSVSWFSTNETNTTTIRIVHQPYINFKCMFVLLQDASVFYKIEWYINNATLIKTVTVSEADIGQATLSSNDLPPLNQTAGLQIQCTVSVRKDLAPSNCKRKTSPVFFAGIKVNQAYHDILRKGKTFVMLYMTIPYVTKTVVVNGQVQPLPALAIYPHLPQSTSNCRGSIGVDKCVIEFKAFSFNERQMYDSDDWRQNQTLVLNHVDTNGYEIDQSMTIQLKTRSDGNTFWNNFNQNISMTITDYNEYWKGTSCGSKTDPHMYTFDGVSYENHIEGEFILYRNMLYNQEVQTKHKQCHPDYNFPHCTCAVSVQSGQDVFIVDLCGDIQFVDFLSCNDSVIQVYKISDKLYKISLPTGTYVMVSLVEWPVQGSWQIDIDIYPSLSDVNNTEGLCGTLDGDRDNDFKRRSGDTDNVNLVYPDDFSNSWKVLDDGNLLKEPLSTRQPISSILDKICMCTSNGDQCSYNTLTHCSTTVEKQFLCTELTVQTSVSRKKRDLSGKWIPPSLSVPKPLTRNKRDVQFNIATSRENAEAVCTSAFESSDPYRTCQEYVSDLSNSSLSNCINDVIMTGDYNITAIHVEAALQQCVTFVGLNTTLQNANSVVTASLQSLCPSNCSAHGVCIKGNCSCEVGFGGSDCSFDILSPPVIWESTPSGICDKSLHQCSRVYLKGRYFLENVDKICFFDKQSIHHDGSILSFNQLESSLEDENLFRGSCSIPSNDVTSWVNKYMFNVSYDRKHFTQSFSFYTYQSECQQHSVEKGLDQFTLKKEYCFINNTCVQLAAINPENRCQECNPGRNNYQWSGIQDCESTTTPEPSALSTSTVIYIVTASVLGFLSVAAIVVLIGVWKYRRSRQYAESSEDENTDYRRDVVSKSWMRFFDDGKFPYIPRGSRYSTQTYSSPKTERFY